ncbi:helix-turn-helix transcriptional regulator [Azospirillum halopraeferens]|uniref:helix-turn-helix transcriptional regulator n=1 Tax=Azospirillum halopraeferens TaxID=34010 RepID=UPI00316ACDFD
MSRSQPQSIALRRRRLGLTQGRLGAMVDMDQATVSRAENGMAPAQAEVLAETLKRLERQREQGDQREANAFWEAVPESPHRDSLLERLEAIASDLFGGSYREHENAIRLLDCLPAGIRTRTLRRLRRTKGE